MKRLIKFENFEMNEPAIVAVLTKAGNITTERIFSLHEIDPSLHISREDIPEFEEWMRKKGFVTQIECIGTDLFRCKLTDEFINSQIFNQC